MSEPISRPQPPEKPAWLQRSKPGVTEPIGDTRDTAEAPSGTTQTTEIAAVAAFTPPVGPRTTAARRRKTATSTKPHRPVRRPEPLVVRMLRTLLSGSVDVHLLLNERTATGLLRVWWKTNRIAFLASLGVHALILMLFALWMLPRVFPPDNFILEGFAAASGSGIGDMEGPIQINTQLTPAEASIGRESGNSKDNGAETAAKKGTGPAGGSVNPVGVEDALAGRGVGGSGGGGSGGGGGGGKEGIWQGLGVGTKPPTGIAGGLAWLVRQQEKGGNWKLHEGYPDAGERTIRTDTGATALALLAFLGDGHTPTEGPHAKSVAKGIAFLKSVQKANGDFHDHEELGRQTAFYAHSQATIAMCEAYALTGDPSLKASCERAVKFLLDSQHPRNGGWRYQPQTGESMGDLSVTGWALMALHSARIAKIDVPIDNFERAALFLESVSEQNGARYKYQPHDPLEKISPAMTAEGLLCRQWLGWPKDHPSQTDALQYLLADENKPSWASGRRNVYAWYYTAQVLHNVGGPAWKAWYQHTSDLILKNQTTGGGEVGGSWHPTRPPGANEEYAAKAGRLYLTAMCLLVLETPIRHAAVYPEKRP